VFHHALDGHVNGIAQRVQFSFEGFDIPPKQSISAPFGVGLRVEKQSLVDYVFRASAFAVRVDLHESALRLSVEHDLPA
jgi:hypothetical protein